jgi:aminotransferase EvaB
MSKPLQTADPQAAYLAHEKEIRAAVDRVLASGRYILGPEVEAFDREFAAYHSSEGVHAVGVANGTEALELALRAVGVNSGDLVVTVANSASATAAAIQQIGARPVFVEIDAATMLMSLASLESMLASLAGKVKAVVPVHLYGHVVPMPLLMGIARRHGAKVVEDCAQAHGAAITGRKIATWGDAAAYSFYPTKNLGALGDGGAVFTCTGAVAERVRLLRQYGWRQRYVSEIPGRNSRLDELQAAILRVKLKYLDAENATRRSLAAHYFKALAGSPLQLPFAHVSTEPVWHQFAVRTPRRDALQAHLASKDIHCGVLYPVPIHRQPAYADPALHLPETERACAEVLCLPVHPAVTTADVDRVSEAIIRWFKS